MNVNKAVGVTTWAPLSLLSEDYQKVIITLLLGLAIEWLALEHVLSQVFGWLVGIISTCTYDLPLLVNYNAA